MALDAGAERAPPRLMNSIRMDDVVLEGPSLNELIREADSGDPGAMQALDLYVRNRRSGEVLGTTRAAAYCGLATSTMYNLASLRGGPVMHKHGRRSVYYPVDLDVFLARRVRPADGRAA